MMHDHWTERILYELGGLEMRVPNRVYQPVVLYDLYDAMLGNSKSDVAVQWDNAIQELRRQGMIAVDRAGYVALTPRGRDQLPTITQRHRRRIG